MLRLSNPNGYWNRNHDSLGEQRDLQADHDVAARPQDRYERRSDVTLVAGAQNSHGDYFQVFQGALSDSQNFSSSFLSRSVSMHCQKPS